MAHKLCSSFLVWYKENVLLICLCKKLQMKFAVGFTIYFAIYFQMQLIFRAQKKKLTMQLKHVAYSSLVAFVSQYYNTFI